MHSQKSAMGGLCSQLWEAPSQGCKSLLSIGGGGVNLQFYPNFALFLTLGGMNLDHDLFQVSKLSEDQKKGLNQKWNTFFPRIQVEHRAHMHTRVKFLEGMQMNTILKLLGGIYPPHSPRVSASLLPSAGGH